MLFSRLHSHQPHPFPYQQYTDRYSLEEQNAGELTRPPNTSISQNGNSLAGMVSLPDRCIFPLYPVMPLLPFVQTVVMFRIHQPIQQNPFGDWRAVDAGACG